MPRPCPEHLLLAVASAALLLLFSGASLPWAAPIGIVVWCVSRQFQRASNVLTPALLILLALYPLYVAIVQLSYWRAGTQGLDFGIFSQVIYQVAHNNRFISSLISTEWQNFITHHFSPFLLILGGVAKLGLRTEHVLIGAHVVAVSALIWGLWRMFNAVGSTNQALILTATALLLPAVRQALGWETHDEILALPLIIFSLWAHLTGRDTLKLVALFPLLLFKETLGIVMCTTALAYAFDGSRSVEQATVRRASMMVAVFGAVFFLTVTQVFPKWLWWPTFDPSSRLASLPRLFDPNLLLRKAAWLTCTALPSVPFLLLHSKKTVRLALVLLAPALYNITAIMVSDFPAMVNPYNYYSVTPAIILLLASSYPVLRAPRFSWAAIAALCLVVTIGHPVRTRSLVKAGFSTPSAYDELRVFVPQRSNIITDNYTASVLADNSYILRIFHARRTRPSFDFIIISKEFPEQLSEALNERSHVCHETPRYTVRCPGKAAVRESPQP